MSFKVSLWLGWITIAVGFGLFAALNPTSNLGEQAGFQVIAGIGIGMLYLTLPLCAQSGLDDELHSVSANIVTFFRSLGSTFGLAIGATIFQNEFTKNVQKNIMSGALDASSAISGEQAEDAFSIIDSLSVAKASIYRHIYSDSLRPLWYLVMALCTVGLLTSFFTKDVSLDRGFKSTQKFIRKEKDRSDPRY
jgi:fucose permease